jgi:hypothetical protein
VHYEYGRPLSYLGHLDRPAGGRHDAASREEAGSGGPHVCQVRKVGPRAGRSEASITAAFAICLMTLFMMPHILSKYSDLTGRRADRVVRGRGW